MPDRKERCAENQYRFNAANERLRDLVEDRARPDQAIPFLCADDACLETVELKMGEYQSLHEDANVFVLVFGHDL